MQLRKTIKHVLRHFGAEQAGISLAIVDHDTIRELKKHYFGRNVSTDVISFDLNDPVSTHDHPPIDCEIIVNAQQAAELARKIDIDPQAELNLYLVHGLLHQFGFDDQKKTEFKKMHHVEDRLLEELGFGKIFEPYQRKGL
jgi:probable rRNA maturation factor